MFDSYVVAGGKPARVTGPGRSAQWVADGRQNAALGKTDRWSTSR